MSTDTMSKDQLNAFLQEVASTAGFEVKFDGDKFTATNGFDRVSGVMGDPGHNAALASKVASELRYPPQPRGPVVGKAKAFRGPAPTPREKYLALIESFKTKGAADERTKHWREVQAEHGLPDLPEGITYEPMWFTPKMAEEFLLTFGGLTLPDGRPAQRPLSRDRVNKYIELMLKGAWGLSPDPIAYAKPKDGMPERGINGQNRAAAVLYTGVAIPVMMSRGWDGYETFKFLDKGLSRTAITTLALEGHARPKDLHAAATLYGRAMKEPLIANWTNKHKPDEAGVLKIVEDYPMLETAVEWAAVSCPTYLNKPALAVARFMAAMQAGPLDENGKPTGDWNATAKYFVGLKNGSGIVEKQPAYAVRTYFGGAGKSAYTRTTERREYDKGGIQLAYFLHGYNSDVQREELIRPSHKITELKVPKPYRPRDAPEALFTAPHVRNPVTFTDD